MIEYVINSLVWSLVGFTLGWVVGAMRTDVKTIREAVVHDEDERAQHARSNADGAQRWLGIVVALLAVATVVQGVAAQQRLNDVSDCQSDYNREFAAASKTRAQLADEDRRALNELLLSLYQQRESTERERLRIFEQWVTTTQQNEKQRQRNPLPQYPSEGDC